MASWTTDSGTWCSFPTSRIESCMRVSAAIWAGADPSADNSDITVEWATSKIKLFGDGEFGKLSELGLARTFGLGFSAAVPGCGLLFGFFRDCSWSARFVGKPLTANRNNLGKN